MARVVEAPPDALVTPKLLRPDGKVNACGMVMQYTGITTCHGYGDNPCRFRGVFPVTLASGAAIMADREVWEALGGFDEHYFLYMEDVELSMRARLGGYPIWCAADAVGLHHYHLGLNPAKFGWLERHRIWTFLKIWSTPTLTRLVPGLLLTEAATWAYAAARGWPYLKARAGAYYWVWQHRRELLKDRRDFQRWRSRDDTDLLSELSVEVPFAQLVASTRMAAHLQAWTTPLYRALKPRDVGLTRTTSGHQPKRPRAI
jgi:hypothetical protein